MQLFLSLYCLLPVHYLLAPLSAFILKHSLNIIQLRAGSFKLSIIFLSIIISLILIEVKDHEYDTTAD